MGQKSTQYHPRDREAFIPNTRSRIPYYLDKLAKAQAAGFDNLKDYLVWLYNDQELSMSEVSKRVGYFDRTGCRRILILAGAKIRGRGGRHYKGKKDNVGE